MSKSIVITGNNGQLAGALAKSVGNFPDLEIVLSMPYGDEMLENLSIAQPTFVICDLLKDEEFKNILDVCLDTTIVIISDDTNRAQSTISNFLKDGTARFINLDMEKITPMQVLSQLNDYDPYKQNDDDFFEEKSESNISKEIIGNTSDLNMTPNTPPIEASDDIPVVEEKHEEVQNNNVPQESNSTPNEAPYIPTEEPVAKPMSQFKEEVRANNGEKMNSAKISAVTQCQVVSIYSKKGGTGKTTIAKEIANIFSNISLPKKLSDKATLDVCLLDLCFEQGDCRTMLGISNPNPNLYMFIDAIVSRLESGIPLERIYFSAPEVKTNFCQDLPSGRFKLLCLNQDEMPKKLVDRILAFQDDELLAKILKKIIKTLRDTFNVLVIDLPPSYNDITELVFRTSSKVVYVLEPDLTSLDNLKSFLDTSSDRCYVTNKLIPILNKDVKSQFKETFITLYDEIRSQNQELAPCNAVAPYDAQVAVSNNNYGFYTNNSSKFKQAVIMVCSAILPVFKVKNISQDLKIVEAKRRADLKKQKLQAQKEATKKFNQEADAKAKAAKAAKSKAKPGKAPKLNKKEAEIAKLKGELPQNPEVENLNAQNLEVASNEADVKEAATGDIRSYLMGDLSKVQTVDQFVSELKACEGVKLTRKGFPMVAKMPKTLNKKVWKQYYKLLSKNLK